MPTLGVHADFERRQNRWILGAIALALLLHLLFAWLLGWYKIPGLRWPKEEISAGPFNVKEIEINPDSLKSEQDNPIAKLPVVEPPKNPSEYNLDPNVVENALKMPQPSLSTPSVPEPSRVIAATDLGQGLPFAESDQAQITAEISKVEPGAVGSPTLASKTAQDMISATAGLPQPGLPAGAPLTGNGTKDGSLPGFAQLVPAFQANTAISNLPEPILLRLPSDVLFDFDSAKLKPEATPLLMQAVDMITKYPQANVQIDGYSDSFGQTDYNSTLSQQRAEAVQAWLQDHAVRGSYKFRSQGHGSADYIVSPQGTIDQQQPNRRVEILIQALKP